MLQVTNPVTFFELRGYSVGWVRWFKIRAREK